MAGCPFFRQRMAVILEAYLLGCGEAMLTSLRQQVQVVNILHEVAIRVKTLYPEKSTLSPSGNTLKIHKKNNNKSNKITVQSYYCLSVSAAQKLHEMLQEYTFPPEFQVPFDPRVRAGAILVSFILYFFFKHFSDLK